MRSSPSPLSPESTLPCRFTRPTGEIAAQALLLVCVLVLATMTGRSACSSELATNRPNILFIAVDDMKPLIGCYGYGFAKTPNMDAIAKQGRLFRSAYCQQAVCGPSRVSIMTGRYPDVTGIYSMGGPQTWLRERHPNIVTMPQHFKQQGYHTASIGKIFDPRNFKKGGTDRIAWSERARVPRSTESDPWGKQLRGGYLDPNERGQHPSRLERGQRENAYCGFWNIAATGSEFDSEKTRSTPGDREH